MVKPHNIVSVSLVREAADRGWSLVELRREGYRVETLVEAFGAQRVVDEACATPVEIYSAVAPRFQTTGTPLTPEFFLKLGFDPVRLLGLFGLEELRKAGVKAQALVGIVSPLLLLKAGYKASEMVEGWP